MRRLRWVVMFAVAGLAGCELSEEQCISGDWTSIGRSDGANGAPEAKIEKHRETCAKFDVVPDTAAWLEGRLDGLKSYCTTSTAFDRTSRGYRFNLDICPNAARNGLAYAMAQGEKYYDLERDIQQIIRERNQLIGDLAALSGTDAATIARRLTLESRLRRLDIEESLLRVDQRRIKA